MSVQLCDICNKIKPLSTFPKSKQYKNGYTKYCKICKNNKQSITRKTKAGKIAHCESSAIWRRNNKNITRLQSAKYRALKFRASPLWANESLIKFYYDLATHLSLQVDHIIPLQNKQVCGLHWEGNLQLLSRKENAKKGNRL